MPSAAAAVDGAETEAEAVEKVGERCLGGWGGEVVPFSPWDGPPRGRGGGDLNRLWAWVEGAHTGVGDKGPLARAPEALPLAAFAPRGFAEVGF